MNTKHFITGALTTSLLVLLTPSASQAERGRGHRPPPLERVLERHAEELGLSDEVLDQVQQLKEGRREAMTPLHEAVKEARQELHSLMEDGSSSESQILAQVEKVSAAEGQLKVEKTKGMLEVRALLSDDQLQKLKELRPKDGQKGGEGKRGGGQCKNKGERSESGRGQGRRGGRGQEQGGEEL